MSIAIEVKVNDGVVLSTDSATTMLGPKGSAYNVYEHANKIFHVHKALPIGAMTWGVGSIANTSVATLLKDFRALITDGESRIDPDSYTVIEVASKLTQFVKAKYDSAFGSLEKKPNLGLLVTGYDANSEFATDYRVDIVDGHSSGPNPIREANETGITWNGVSEPITRLILGFGTELSAALADAGISKDQVQEVMVAVRARMTVNFAPPAMPIQDAIALAVFLAELTTNFTKYAPGPPTVGGPIEVAAITKHEGFKWVQRKHYYNLEYNVPGGMNR